MHKHCLLDIELNGPYDGNVTWWEILNVRIKSKLSVSEAILLKCILFTRGFRFRYFRASLKGSQKLIYGKEI